MKPSIRLLLVGAIVMLVATGCGSSTKDATSSEPSTTVAAGECPFSGSTESQAEPGTNTATELTAVTPATDGCIDNVTFGFDPTLATSTVAYETAVPGKKNVLVVTLQNATLGDSLEAGTTVEPKGLNHVSNVALSSAGETVEWRITLDEQRPFVVSSSYLPPQLVVAIG